MTQPASAQALGDRRRTVDTIIRHWLRLRRQIEKETETQIHRIPGASALLDRASEKPAYPLQDIAAIEPVSAFCVKQ